VRIGAEDFRRFVSTNLEGFIFVTQLAVKQMLAQDMGRSVTTITAALARNPIAGISASIPMLTKGGRDALRLASRASTQKGKSASMRLLPAL